MDDLAKRVQEAHEPQQPTMPPEWRHHIEVEARKRLRAELRQALLEPLVPAHGPRPLSLVDLSCDRLRPPRPAPADLVGRALPTSKAPPPLRPTTQPFSHEPGNFL